ncbi:aspartate/glutamate racemase family protein, partial [Nonomuraea insulae]
DQRRPGRPHRHVKASVQDAGRHLGVVEQLHQGQVDVGKFRSQPAEGVSQRAVDTRSGEPDGPLYPRALAARGIAAELPDADDRDLVNAVIFKELVNGVISDASRQEYLRVIERLAGRGCDAVALVCTEIPLLITPDVSPLPTLDSTRLLARAAYDVAVGERAMPEWRGGPR